MSRKGDAVQLLEMDLRAAEIVYVREYQFAKPRRWRFDFAIPGRKIAIEVDGATWTGGRHTSGSGFTKDMEKFNEAGLLGWRIFRVTPQQVKNGQAIVLLERIFEKRIDEKARKWKP